VRRSTRFRPNAKAIAKRVVLSLAHTMGLHHLARPLLGGVGTIFVIHRVIEPGEPVLDPTQAVATEVIEQCLDYVLRAGYEIISLDEIPDRLALDTARPHARRPFVCFTFDDGYRDNLTLALPLFRRFQAPLAIYVLTGFPDRQFTYWWRAAERLVLHHDVIRLRSESGVRSLASHTFAEKRAAYFTLCHTLIRNLHDIALPLFAAYGIDPCRLLSEDTLSWSDLRQLALDPLVTIGAHTITHPILSELNAHSAREELAASKARLEEVLGISVRHFAYPYGGSSACGRREYALAQEVGFKTATTTRPRNVFPSDRHHLWSLPRISLNDTVSPISDLQLQLSGLSAAATMRLNHPMISKRNADRG
jgi:peptidoglycan/xylan/chitin deacetylase (PgdA/CDA1 family)